MFENPFSFEGRIRRTEYGLSVLIVACIAAFISVLMELAKEMGVVFVILYILFAEGDIGANKYGEDPKGGLRNVPSQPQNGFNQWQNNTSPKNTSGFGIQNTSQQGNFYNGGRNASPNTSQQGSFYNGGHNANQQSQKPTPPPNNSGDFNGDLYRKAK